jgi:hypothetical protein
MYKTQRRARVGNTGEEKGRQEVHSNKLRDTGRGEGSMEFMQANSDTDGEASPNVESDYGEEITVSMYQLKCTYNYKINRVSFQHRAAVCRRKF